MSLVERLDGLMDLEFARKLLLWISAGALVLIPVDALSIYTQKPKPAPAGPAVRAKAPPGLDPEESVLAAFDKSPLIGGLASGLSVPALRAS